MGQQQLLLIVLGVIIVGIAIAVGISMFKSNAQSSNRDQVINDLNNLAAKAQQYFRKPLMMAGGGQSFSNFTIGTADSMNPNGMYWTSKTAPTAFVAYPGQSNPVTFSTADTVCYIYGIGTEVGNDNTNKVEAAIMITPTLPGNTQVLN
jgi:Tfp pilus assembly protein PilE